MRKAWAVRAYADTRHATESLRRTSPASDDVGSASRLRSLSRALACREFLWPPPNPRGMSDVVTCGRGK